MRVRTNFNCTVEGCERGAVTRGWCHMHYSRWYVNGDPLVVKKPHRVELVDGKKLCAFCGEHRELTRFPPSPKALHGRGSHCYDCRGLKKRAAQYGITPERFREMLAKQDGRCAICLGQPGIKGLAVDHCHSTGAVRGLLCGRCNTAIGLLREDPVIFRAAMDYLAS